MGLRGLELRANHAVAIEPISGRRHLADFLRSNVAELPKNPQKGLAISCKRSGTIGNSGAPRGALRSCPAGLIAEVGLRWCGARPSST